MIPLFFCCLYVYIAQARLFLPFSAPLFHNSRSSVFPSTPSIGPLTSFLLSRSKTRCIAAHSPPLSSGDGAPLAVLAGGSALEYRLPDASPSL